jgi:hypothetical protein
MQNQELGVTKEFSTVFLQEHGVRNCMYNGNPLRLVAIFIATDGGSPTGVQRSFGLQKAQASGWQYR